jgi:hypothetical protein
MSGRLPKQWAHWMRSAHLRTTSGRKHRFKYSDLRGRGRYWRVVGIGGQAVFQMSEPYAKFDRWSNSVEMGMPLPKTRADFINTVSAMVDIANQKEPEYGSP